MCPQLDSSMADFPYINISWHCPMLLNHPFCLVHCPNAHSMTHILPSQLGFFHPWKGCGFSFSGQNTILTGQSLLRTRHLPPILCPSKSYRASHPCGWSFFYAWTRNETTSQITLWFLLAITWASKSFSKWISVCRRLVVLRDWGRRDPWSRNCSLPPLLTKWP